jgi:hypothetical protein
MKGMTPHGITGLERVKNKMFLTTTSITNCLTFVYMGEDRSTKKWWNGVPRGYKFLAQLLAVHTAKCFTLHAYFSLYSYTAFRHNLSLPFFMVLLMKLSFVLLHLKSTLLKRQISEAGRNSVSSEEISR